jgi:hypothetical protein
MPVQGDIPPVDGADTTVHIEADSVNFKFILDLVTDPDGSTDDDPDEDNFDSIYEIDEVLEVGHRLGFTQLPRMMLPIMHKYVTSSPWYVLAFAAKNDFMVLAIYAIERMTMHDHFKTLSVFDIRDEMLDDIPGKYVAPLIRNMTLFRMDDGATDWEKVAHNFPHIREGRNVSRARSIRADTRVLTCSAHSIRTRGWEGRVNWITQPMFSRFHQPRVGEKIEKL